MGGCTCCNREGPNDLMNKEIKCLELPEYDDNAVADYAGKPSGQQDNDDIIFNHVAFTLRSSKEEVNVILYLF